MGLNTLVETDLYYIKEELSSAGHQMNYWLHRRGQSLHLALFVDRDTAYLAYSLLNAHAAINGEIFGVMMDETKADKDDTVPL